MSDRFVISLSGERGKGPWFARNTPIGAHICEPASQAKVLREAYRWGAGEALVSSWDSLRENGCPSAKVFRLVRRSKPTLTTLERAVVEAAMAELSAREQEAVDDLDDSWGEEHERRRSESTARAYEAREAADAATRALRAKRGG